MKHFLYPIRENCHPVIYAIDIRSRLINMITLIKQEVTYNVLGNPFISTEIPRNIPKHP